MKPIIKIKRIYEAPSPKDGHRILIDGLWPRGFTKEKASVDEWIKEIAPTPALRKWFGHAPERWKEFQKKYRDELKKNKSVESFIEKNKTHKLITLIYAGKDEKHTHALVLQQFLEEQFDKK